MSNFTPVLQTISPVPGGLQEIIFDSARQLFAISQSLLGLHAAAAGAKYLKNAFLIKRYYEQVIYSRSEKGDPFFVRYIEILTRHSHYINSGFVEPDEEEAMAIFDIYNQMLVASIENASCQSKYSS